jgi:uncharacterized membrane protein YesL
MYKQHFLDKNLPSKIGAQLMHIIFFNIYIYIYKKNQFLQKKAVILLTTEPATTVLYAVKLPVETS